jgi:hypothetical protein
MAARLPLKAYYFVTSARAAVLLLCAFKACHAVGTGLALEGYECSRHGVHLNSSRACSHQRQQSEYPKN